MTASAHQHGKATIEVFNDYPWMGDPRFGNFALYVDGVKADIAVLGASAIASVTPGPHTIRVRHGYFLSPRVTVVVKPGERARFGANAPRHLPFVLGMLKLCFDPFHSLTLVRDEGARF